MAKPTTLALLVLIALVPTAGWADPIVETWKSRKGSYDVHAEGVDKFMLDSRGSGPRSNVANFTVRPGDKVNQSTGERSEVVLGGWESTSRFKVRGDEGTEFYRISVKLDVNWLPPDANSYGQKWGMFFQLHGPNEYAAPPAVALLAEDKFALFVLGGDMNKKQGGKRFLTNSDLNVGNWVDFILEIKWAPDNTGAIAVYRRDEGASGWEKVSDIKSVATLQYRGSPNPNDPPHYWKAGFYRSESQHVNSLWLGPIVRGKTFAEVANY